ncbi:hypothetical protein ACFQE8_06935 [Salinirubellus sp. GCM10025818]|uniref:DUF7089 family protein n=1 Tax=Salinirubellus TaxID=2162630 RepID=UPI0030D524BF
MFDRRELSGPLAAVRDRHAPVALVLDVAGDFEILPPELAENLGPMVDRFDPLSYPDEWVPRDAPEQLYRLAGGEFTIGMPGEGGVAWTRQTDPPTVFVKPRLEGSPDAFVSFLIGEALVEAGTGLPEHFLGFFESRYAALAGSVPLSPADTYQLANAVYDAYVGLHTRETFEGWESNGDDETPGDSTDLTPLYEAWVDAGERLEPRLSGLMGEVATGETSFAAAAELACSAVKHGVDPPTPFGALDTAAYRHHGADYAVEWIERTLAELEDG